MLLTNDYPTNFTARDSPEVGSPTTWFRCVVIRLLLLRRIGKFDLVRMGHPEDVDRIAKREG